MMEGREPLAGSPLIAPFRALIAYFSLKCAVFEEPSMEVALREADPRPDSTRCSGAQSVR